LTGCTLGVEGESGYSNWGGYYGGYAITKGCKYPYKALDLLEYMVSPEGSTLRLYGIEGTHYTVADDGSIEVNLEGRNAERVQYFGSVTNADGTTSLGGLHTIGGRFGYAVDWDYYETSGGQIAVKTDIGSLYPAYGSLVRQAISYTKDLQTSKLLNVTSFPSTIDIKRADVQNLASAYINTAIIGKASNLESGWANMLKELEKAGYGTVKAVMKETAEELGII
jgi:hypothetical protein